MKECPIYGKNKPISDFEGHPECCKECDKEISNDYAQSHKICSRCGKLLPLDKFNKRNDRGGYQSWCRDCTKLYLRLNTKYKTIGGVKYCKICHRILPKTDFVKDENHKCGYSTHCKECDAKLSAKANQPINVETIEAEKEMTEKELLDSLENEVKELRKRGYQINCYIVKKFEKNL